MVAPALPLVPDDVLIDADTIVLVDPVRPGWHLTLMARRISHGRGRVEIPVNSQDTMQLWEWRKRVAALSHGE